MRLGTSGTSVDGEEPAYERCLLGVYYFQTPMNHKEIVTSSFEGLCGKVWLVIASTSLSMGVDFPHVQYVVHYGPPRNLTSHLQEAGRGEIDGEQAFHLTVYHGCHLTACEKDNKVNRVLLSHCTAPSLKVAVIILELINETFNNILITDELYSLVYSKEYLSDLNRSISTIPLINVTGFEDLSDDSNSSDSLL